MNLPVGIQATFPNVTVVQHPLLRVKLTRLRDKHTKSEDFRRLLSEIATLMVYEAARDFATTPVTVETPLASCEGSALQRPVIVAPILRAGLGLVDGMLNVLSEVSVGHIGMYRNEQTLKPESYYFKLPSHLPRAEVLVVDPMLATGWSATAAISQLKQSGAQHIRFLCVVSSPQGLKQITDAHLEVPIFTATIDEGLNEKGYIVPGLGDAGDRYFGTFAWE